MEEYVPVDYEAESRRLQKERRELEQAMSILHVVGIPICSRLQGRHIGLN